MRTESSTKLQKGSEAQSFKLKGADGETYSLENFRGAKALLVVFMCNHCPYVKTKLPELNKIALDFKAKGLAVVGINSNDAEQYPEDSFEAMINEIKSGNVKFPYLYDETQEVAKSYGATCTPDSFLFDKNFKLIFHSRIGNPPRPEPSTENLLYNAIAEFLETGAITKVKELPSVGCSIKWK